MACWSVREEDIQSFHGIEWTHVGLNEIDWESFCNALRHICALVGRGDPSEIDMTDVYQVGRLLSVNLSRVRLILLVPFWAERRQFPQEVQASLRMLTQLVAGHLAIRHPAIRREIGTT